MAEAEPTRSSNPLTAALAYAALGLAVVPLHTVHGGRCSCGRANRADGTPDCSAGKHPRTARGLLEASRDPAQIASWWMRWPDANVGVRTGNGLLVLDVDPRHGGDAAFADLLARNPEGLPLAPICASGSRIGYHVYLGVPPSLGLGNSAGRLGAGIDTRGEGGYVLAPPSGHVSGGAYTWFPGFGVGEVAIAPAPVWLIVLLGGPKAGVAAKANGGATALPNDWVALLGAIPEGRRDETLARLAGALFRRLRPALAYELLRAVNEARCRPPLSTDEVDKVANSIASKELAKTGGRK